MTQHQAIIEYMEKNGALSSFMAVIKLGVSNLPLRVSELRAKGYKIADRTIHHTNRYGAKVHYKEYFLKKEQGGN